MIAWFARNGVAANLLMFTILALGAYSLIYRIPLEIFPTYEKDIITVGMSLRGATPEDVEKSLTIRIEESVQDLQGIKKITSTSSEGRASVNIEIDDRYDSRDMLSDIKSRVDAINGFPSDAEKANIAIEQRKREVIVVTLASDYSEKEMREYGEVIRDELLQIDGITLVELNGTRNYEIIIETSQDKLRQYDLSVEEVALAVGRSSLDLSSGNLKTVAGDVLIRSKGQAYRKDEFAGIPIKTSSDGSIIKLEDLAEINDGFEETPIRSRFNGKNAVFLDVYRIGQQNAIDVGRKVRDYINSKQKDLPKGYELQFWDDDSVIVKNRIGTLAQSAIQGGILVLIFLSLFLRPIIAFWVFVGIPVSFMGAFLMMPFFDVTLNVMSLFGFILVLGIVVDDAIVTGENIYNHLGKSKNGEIAAINGTKEIALPVTFGVLTTIVAFLPLAFIEGDRAALFNPMPYVVIPVLLFSLIESKFVLPSHLKKIKPRSAESLNRFERFQKSIADGFESAIFKFYRPTLGWCLRNKLTTLSLFLFVFLITVSIVLSGHTKFTFFPRVPSETVRADLNMPAGTAFEITDRHVEKLTEKAQVLQEKYRDPETNESVVINILSMTRTSSIGRVRFEITPPEVRTLKVDAMQLANEWRELMGDIPGAENISYRSSWGRNNPPVNIQLSGGDMKMLEEASNAVKAKLHTYETVFDISDSLSDGKEEIQVELLDQGKALGFSLAEVSRQVRQAYFGTEVQRIQRGRDDVRITVRLPLEERQSLSDLEGLLIKGPGELLVPLSHIAKLVPGKGPSSIKRVNRYRTVNVTADFNKAKTDANLMNRELVEFLDTLNTQYPGISYSLEGEAKEQEEAFSSMAVALGFVLFAIYVLLAISFKSYIQPLIVLSVIPFGIVGALVGHWIMGMGLTLLSVMGMMALVGVVVNDSLVLVDYMNKKRKGSQSLREVVLSAGVARFRPVILTSLTTFIGLVPLFFDKSTQAQYLLPMAVSLAYGILFATVITLLLIPVNYMLLESKKSKQS